VPPKVRELIKSLKQAGFEDRGGQGQSSEFRPPGCVETCDDFWQTRRRCQKIPGTGCGKGSSGVQKVKKSALYAKIVEWSEEDQCFVGSAPGLLYGGCHGSDEKEVFAELCRIVDEAIELYQLDGKPLPPSITGRDLANSLQKIA